MDDGAATTRDRASIGVGSVVAGKYRVERVLGVGGMGYVLAARDIQLDRRVAVKLLLEEVLASAEASARFLQEARAAVKIQSEHVVRVIDVGTAENGAPYMVMEYLDGCDLGELIRSQGPLPVSEAVRHVLEACEALAEAHAAGIVHRDLKPANLYLANRQDGSSIVKVLDFGISKLQQAGDQSLTKTSSVMGSPLYMSPEQMRSARNVDARTDQWALGCILYELVAGVTPFTGETLPEVLFAVVTEEPKPLSSLRQDLPDGFEAVVMRCLAKDRTKRFSDVAELAAALLPFASTDERAAAARMSRVLVSAGVRSTQVDLASVAVTRNFGPSTSNPTLQSPTGDPLPVTERETAVSSAAPTPWTAISSAAPTLASATPDSARAPRGELAASSAGSALAATALAAPTLAAHTPDAAAARTQGVVGGGTTGAWTDSAEAPQKKRSGNLALAAVAIVVVLGAGGAGLYLRSQGGAVAAPPSPPPAPATAESRAAAQANVATPASAVPVVQTAAPPVVSAVLAPPATAAPAVDARPRASQKAATPAPTPAPAPAPTHKNPLSIGIK